MKNLTTFTKKTNWLKTFNFFEHKTVNNKQLSDYRMFMSDNRMTMNDNRMTMNDNRMFMKNKLILNHNNMKNNLLTTLLFTFAILSGVETCFSQTQLYTVIVGDNAILNVTGANGTIQWQESTDSLAWTDIAGATTTPYTIITTTSVTGKRFFRAKITDALCPNATPFYSSVIRHKILANATLIVIGDWYQGGIVFYTDGTGHGLIAPQTDQSTGVQWGCYGTSIPGAASLTDGAANTIAIVAACTTTFTPIAASICDTLTLNCYTDWFLPAKDQLNQLYLQKTLVGGFSGHGYWCSSEYNAGFAWKQSFGYGDQYNGSKSNSNYVRCVRSF